MLLGFSPLTPKSAYCSPSAPRFPLHSSIGPSTPQLPPSPSLSWPPAPLDCCPAILISLRATAAAREEGREVSLLVCSLQLVPSPCIQIQPPPGPCSPLPSPAAPHPSVARPVRGWMWACRCRMVCKDCRSKQELGRPLTPLAPPPLRLIRAAWQ